MAKLINPDGCLICAHIDGSIVSVLLAASVLTDVNHLVKNTVLASSLTIKITARKNGTPKGVVTQLMKEPSLIEEPAIAVEVHLSILSDDHYGPLCDSIKHSFGHEYEFKLKRTLDKFGLAYIGEEQMRAKGYDKTPDIKLEVPIAVDGHVVNWIESKASFGDEYSHKMYLKDQFWSYWNRFGPGMVIYWFGFIEELDVNRDKGIILREDFPENIVKMDPSLR